MEQDKISVIVPVYNTATYLDKSISSILGQSYRNLEIILINDGSTDNSAALCDAYALKDSRIRVIHKANMGVSAARNDGLDAASGEYIAFVDSDDVIAPHMLETLHDLVVSYGADMSVCGYARIGSQDMPWDMGSTEKTGIFSRMEALRNFITTYGYCGFLCNKLFRRELFEGSEQLRLDTEILVCEDLLMTCLLTERADIVAFTEEKLYGYLQRGDASALHIVTEKTLTSLVARKRLIDIYSRNGLSDAQSWYVYAVADMMTRRNSEVVRRNFVELLRNFEEYHKEFDPQLHGKKEILVVRLLAAAPRFFSGFWGILRNIRSKL